jgi:hypothetical protein
MKGGIVCAKSGVDDGVAAVVFTIALFDARLRAADTLNIGDRMGIFSYEPEPDLMLCAQTRSLGRSSLKCKSDTR